jgi:hypothetical protein
VEGKYVPAPGAGVSAKEAEQIGRSIDQLTTRLKRWPTAKEFARAAKRTTDPAHKVMARKVKEFSRHAWEMAANYCFRSIRIVKEPESVKSKKAFYSLELSQRETRAPVIISISDIATNLEAIGILEHRFRLSLFNDIQNLRDAVGCARARQLVEEVIAESFKEAVLA